MLEFEWKEEKSDSKKRVNDERSLTFSIQFQNDQTSARKN